MKARIITAVLVAASAGFGFMPLAHADQQQAVAPSTEAWYQPNPTCQLPVGCVGTGSLPAQPPVALPAATPYPAGSLHVAVSGGQETARTYLSFSLPLFDATLSAASLDIPLDTAQADGNLTPEKAAIQVCSFQGSLTAVGGSIDNPPTASCTAHAKATYVGTGTPKLHVDLTPLLSQLSSGAGLVLLPDSAVVQPSDAWHVVFSAHDRSDAGKTPPAMLNATLTPNPEPTFDSGLGSTPAAPTAPVAAAPAPATLSVPAVPQPAPMTPTVDNPAPAAPAPVQAVPQARTITVGYAYPAVWLLPLAFLIVVPLVARSLTRDLSSAPTGS